MKQRKFSDRARATALHPIDGESAVGDQKPEQVECLEGWEIVGSAGGYALSAVYVIQRIGEENTRSALKVFDIQDMEMEQAERKIKEAEREAEIQFKIRECPNIVRCEEGARRLMVDQPPFRYRYELRMELLQPLPDWIKEQGGYDNLRENDIIRIGRDICHAIETCWENRIVHLDVKPSNIFYDQKDDSFKLGDFGSAWEIEEETEILWEGEEADAPQIPVRERGYKVYNVPMHEKRGTKAYMAPEFWCYGTCSASTDTFSLGLVLYELLNDGYLPFCPRAGALVVMNSEKAFENRIEGKKIPPPRKGSKALQDIIARICDYYPQLRYDSPGKVWEELQKLLPEQKEIQPENKDSFCLYGKVLEKGKKVVNGVKSLPIRKIILFILIIGLVTGFLLVLYFSFQGNGSWSKPAPTLTPKPTSSSSTTYKPTPTELPYWGT